MWEVFWILICIIVASVVGSQIVYQTVELLRILREKRCKKKPQGN